MPTNITIKGIPDEVYELLKAKAEQNHRSINSEVIITLTHSVSSKRPDAETILHRADLLRSKSRGMIAMDEIQAYIQTR